jgi:hypothetical protein
MTHAERVTPREPVKQHEVTARHEGPCLRHLLLIGGEHPVRGGDELGGAGGTASEQIAGHGGWPDRREARGDLRGLLGLRQDAQWERAVGRLAHDERGPQRLEDRRHALGVMR